MEKRFSKQSDLYARYRPDYPQEMYEHIFQHLSARHTAWDCATGSGQIAKYLSAHFDKVYATDISGSQLEHAPKKDNVIYRNVSAEKSGLPDNYFDLITVGQAIHWFDFDSFYQEVNRVGQAGGLLAVIGYGMVRVNPQVNPIIDRLYDLAFDSYYSENRQYLDNQYQTLPFPFEEIAAPSFENTFHWSIDELEGYFNSWSAVQKMKTEQHINPVKEIIEDIQSAMTSSAVMEIKFPVFMRLGRID